MSFGIAPASVFLHHAVFFHHISVAVTFEGPALLVESMVAPGAQKHPVCRVGWAIIGPEFDVVCVTERGGSAAPNAPMVALADGKGLSFGE